MKKYNLGSAHTGFHDWYWQRISAVILLITTPLFFFIIFATYNGNISATQLNEWLTHPIGKTLAVLFLLTTSMHIWIGLKVVVEDYLHTSFGRGLALNIILFCIVCFDIYMIYHIWAEVSYTLSCIPCGGK